MWPKKDSIAASQLRVRTVGGTVQCNESQKAVNLT